MRILIIDNNIDLDCWGAGELCAMARLAPGASIHIRRAPQQDLPERPSGFDRVIVSGSKTSLQEAPWIEQLESFMGRTIDAGIPLLGVCYGHQALARVLGGKKIVARGAQGEFGWSKVELIGPESRLLRDLPRVFNTFQAHQDEVTSLPKGTRKLARSERCEIQAYELEGKPAYGIQFHPERPMEAGEKSLALRLRETPGAECLNRGKGAKLFDPKIGETIFKNFLALENS